MATENTEVKEFIEKVEVEPTKDDEIVEIQEKETPADSSPQEETEGAAEDDSKKPDELVRKSPAEDTKKPEDGDDNLADVEGETPREHALRLEVDRQRRINRELRGEDLKIKPGNQPAKKELSEDKKRVLAKYKPEDLQNLREVIDVLADDMGFARKEEMGATSYTEKASQELDNFLEKHPEYLPENDKGNVLWGRFKEEYGLYKQPENPKEFKKLFEKVHQTVFGIKSAGDIKKIDASREKIKVASHSGASKPTTRTERTTTPSGVRFDMLKGFTDEEKAELGG